MGVWPRGWYPRRASWGWRGSSKFLQESASSKSLQWSSLANAGTLLALLSFIFSNMVFYTVKVVMFLSLSRPFTWNQILYRGLFSGTSSYAFWNQILYHFRTCSVHTCMLFSFWDKVIDKSLLLFYFYSFSIRTPSYSLPNMD